jgi:hypothetical protein
MTCQPRSTWDPLPRKMVQHEEPWQEHGHGRPLSLALYVRCLWRSRGRSCCPPLLVLGMRWWLRQGSGSSKCHTSRSSFILSGEQSKFPLHLYCYGKGDGDTWKHSDKSLDIPKHTQTNVQYHLIEVEDQGKHFSAAQLLDGRKHWEECCNASVRCSKREIKPLVDRASDFVASCCSSSLSQIICCCTFGACVPSLETFAPIFVLWSSMWKCGSEDMLCF